MTSFNFTIRIHHPAGGRYPIEAIAPPSSLLPPHSPIAPRPILLKSPPIKEPALYFALDLSLCYKWEKFHKLHKQEEKTC
jgi:hypothetical protein